MNMHVKDSGMSLGDILAEALAKRDAKFKVGDRVRLVKDGLSTTGAVGKLATIDSWGDEVVDKENGQYLLKIDPPHHDYSTLACDRAYTRATPDCFIAVAPQQQPLTLTAGRYYKTRDGQIVGPIEEEGSSFRAYVAGKVRLFAASGEHLFGDAGLDLVEEAPLRIEAGRYYRTRDGRKVGPMTGPEYSSYFNADVLWCGTESFRWDGRCYDRDTDSVDDLIAEWTDEPVAGKGCAAAEVDNLRDEYGWAATAKEEPKFKVGDRVKFRDDYESSAAGKEATVIKVNVWGDDGIQVDQGGEWGVSTEVAKDLRLVAPATSGKFKVGDRVRYVTNEPHYGAAYTDGLMTISGIGGGDFGDDVDLSYGDRWYSQVARLVDIDLVAHSSPAIVARLVSGRPRPAARPCVHADRADAEAEAKRLAAANPGEEFGVYEFVSSVKETKTYEHEWQRLAVTGDREAAKRELRKLGIVGWSADIAVDTIAA